MAISSYSEILGLKVPSRREAVLRPKDVLNRFFSLRSGKAILKLLNDFEGNYGLRKVRKIKRIIGEAAYFSSFFETLRESRSTFPAKEAGENHLLLTIFAMAGALRIGESIGDHFDAIEEIKFNRIAENYIRQFSDLAAKLGKKPKDLTPTDLLGAVSKKEFEVMPSI